MGLRAGSARTVGEPWAEEWDAHGSRELMTGSGSWPGDLVLAMVRPSDEELQKATDRYGASEEWEKTNTRCELCEPPKMLDWLMDENLPLKVASQWLSRCK